MMLINPLATKWNVILQIAGNGRNELQSNHMTSFTDQFHRNEPVCFRCFILFPCVLLRVRLIRWVDRSGVVHCSSEQAEWNLVAKSPRLGNDWNIATSEMLWKCMLLLEKYSQYVNFRIFEIFEPAPFKYIEKSTHLYNGFPHLHGVVHEYGRPLVGSHVVTSSKLKDCQIWFFCSRSTEISPNHTSAYMMKKPSLVTSRI